MKLNYKTNNLEHHQLLSTFLTALQTDPLFRIEIARAVMNNLRHMDYITPYFDLQVMPQLIPARNMSRVSYYLQRFKEYFNEPIYRTITVRRGTRNFSARRRILTPEEVIHLRGVILRPNSQWAKNTRADHKSKHPELYATKEQIKEQQATNTGRYAYRNRSAARVLAVNP